MNQSINSLTTHRDSGFDVLKFVAAFFVICLHSNLSGFGGGDVLKAVARCAVPSFFMITGFFYPMLVEKGRFRSHFIKILKLTAFAFVLNLPYAVAECSLRRHPVTYFLSFFSWSHLSDLVLGGYTSSLFFHLWYFLILIYALLLFRLFERIGILSFLSYLAPLLLLTSFIDRADWMDWDLTNHKLWNTALPYMLTGYFLKEKVCINKLSKRKLWIATAVILLVGLPLELYFQWTGKNMSVMGECLAIPLFLLAFRFPHFGMGSWVAYCGQHCATYIYIIHPLFIFLINRCRERLFCFPAPLIPIFVFALTCAVVLLFLWLKSRRKNAPIGLHQ